MPELTIHAINSMHTDETKDVVHIECTTDSHIADLDVHSGALSTLVLGLRQASEALLSGSGDFFGQPLELTRTGLVSLEDGRIMLELVFDGSLRVVANVPDPAIHALQECLFAMDELRRPMTKGTTKH
jgi:hypothetical protein